MPLRIDPATAEQLSTLFEIDMASGRGDAARRAFIERAVLAGECHIAFDDGAPTGFAIFSRSFYGQAFIDLVVVHPQHRRRGIATALMRHVEEICPSERLFTSTNESNTPMQRLCGSLGYARSGRIENLDEGDPEIVYFKRLGKP